MKEKLNNFIQVIKDNKIKTTFIISLILIIIIGTSYAVFHTDAETEHKDLTLATLDIEYIDGQTINAGNSLPLTDDEIEEYASKTNFSVKNKSNVPVYLEVALTNIVMDDELKNSSFMYAVYQENTQIASGTFADCGTELVLKNDIGQYVSNTAVNYTIAIWIQDNGGNQNSMLNRGMSAKIRVKAINKAQGGVPKEYQQVEYIQSTGTQYIDTGISYSSSKNYRIETRTTCEAGTYSGSGWNSGGWFGVINAANLNWTDGTNTTNLSAKVLTDIVLEINQTTQQTTSSFTQGTVTETIVRANGNITNYTKVNYPIFSITSTGTNLPYQGYVGKLYYLKFYSNNILVGDFVPCYRKSDGVIGLYDLVTKEFYTNSGTGTFTAGNNI